MHDTPPKKILIIRLSSVGDVICSLPLVSAVRHQHKNAKIYFLVSSKAKDIVLGHKYLDGVIILNRKEGISSFFKVLKKLRELKLDVVIDAQNQLRSSIFAALSSAKIRIGFQRGVSKEPAYLFMNKKVKLPHGGVHSVDRFLLLAKAFGVEDSIIRSSATDFSIPFAAEKDVKVSEFLSKLGNKLVGLSVSGSLIDKKWPAKKWAQLSDSLLEKGFTPVVIWGPGDESIVDEIKNTASSNVFISPPTNWRELGALLQECELVIGNDSGPLHLAVALGVRCIGLYGPTDTVKNGPYGFNNVGLRGDLTTLSCFKPDKSIFDKGRCRFFRTCQMQRCIDLISVEDVSLQISINPQKPPNC